MSIITIDGQDYDAITGLPVTSPVPVETHQPTPAPILPKVTHPTRYSERAQHDPASKIHSSKPQPSQTLRRRALKKPGFEHKVVKRAPAAVKHMDISPVKRSPVVQRFAPHPVGALHPKPISPIVDRPAVVHPAVAKAAAKSEARAAQPLTSAITSQQIKNKAIKEAIGKTKKQKPLKNRWFSRNNRVISIMTAVLAVVMLGGYYTYINMPTLSVRVAASQAGIDASYPSYRPDGYALNGPVTYGDGRVSMNFKSNTGEHNYTINQVRSSWDSTALLDNYVSGKADGKYTPVTERGLTIYTYGDNAAWVNGGILYTIEGDAPLSSSQIRKIATSLL